MTTPAPPHPSVQSVHGGAANETPASDDMPRHERDRVTAALVRRLRDCTDPNEDQHIRHELIAVNVPLARLLARRYRHRGESMDDLEQVACLNLIEAAQRFDPALAQSFHSYCIPTILGGLRRHFRDRGWTVRPPRRLQELQQATLRAQADLESELNRSPTVAEIAAHLDIDLEDVAEALTLRSCYSPLRLDRPFGDKPDGATLGELLPSGSTDTFVVEARVMLASAMGSLSPRDKRIVNMRFVQGLTQREIAEDIGVTQMQISRLLARILKDLRRSLGPLEEPPVPVKGPSEATRPEPQPEPRRSDTEAHAGSHDPQTVRAWAATQRITIPARGRIPNRVWAAYESAC